jgi:hypothetical protein
MQCNDASDVRRYDTIMRNLQIEDFKHVSGPSPHFHHITYFVRRMQATGHNSQITPDYGNP